MLIKLMFTKLGSIFSSSLGKMGVLLTLLLIISLIVLPIVEGWTISQILWWFPVTITTVGYGDLAPQTLIGRIIGLLVMFGGIGAASIAIGGVISKLVENKAKKMNGSGYYTKKGHIVVFGWIPGKTKSLIDEIKADSSYQHCHIVLCADNIEENPLPKDITFIKGRLSSQDILERAYVTHALKVVIYTESDEQSVLTTLAVDAANKDMEIVVYVQEEEYAEHIRRIDRLDEDGHISIIEPCSIGMIAQELQDKGVSKIIQSLLSNKTNKTIFKLPVEGKLQYGDCCSRTAFNPLIHPIGFEDLYGELVIFPEDREKHCSFLYVVADKRPVLNLKN